MYIHTPRKCVIKKCRLRCAGRRCRLAETFAPKCVQKLKIAPILPFDNFDSHNLRFMCGNNKCDCRQNDFQHSTKERRKIFKACLRMRSGTKSNKEHLNNLLNERQKKNRNIFVCFVERIVFDKTKVPYICTKIWCKSPRIIIPHCWRYYFLMLKILAVICEKFMQNLLYSMLVCSLYPPIRSLFFARPRLHSKQSQTKNKPKS